jgi:uncharacterized protein (DUF58 family)
MFTGAIASKRETALRCFAVFAHLGTRHGNQAGALIAAEQELHVRMRQGITHARKLVEAAVAIKTPDGTPHRLHHALAVYPTTFKRNGLAVVISDLRSPRWQQELRLVARHREVMVIQIVDRRERTLEPGTKLANWRDPITGRVCTPDGSNDDQRRKYSAQCEAFLVETKEDVAGVGASHLVLETDKVETDEQLVDAIEQFLYARKLRKGDNHARVA